MNVDDLGEAGQTALEAVTAGRSREELVARAPLIEAYCVAADVLDRLQAEWASLGFPVMLTGPRGAVSAHPLLGEMRRQSASVAELAKHLGVTAARERSMTGKNLRAPDRLRAVR